MKRGTKGRSVSVRNLSKSGKVKVGEPGKDGGTSRNGVKIDSRGGKGDKPLGIQGKPGFGGLK